MRVRGRAGTSRNETGAGRDPHSRTLLILSIINHTVLRGGVDGRIHGDVLATVEVPYHSSSSSCK